MTDRVLALAGCCITFSACHMILAALKFQLTPEGFVAVTCAEAASRAGIAFAICSVFRPALSQVDVYCPLIKGGVALRRKAQSSLGQNSKVRAHVRRCRRPRPSRGGASPAGARRTARRPRRWWSPAWA